MNKPTGPKTRLYVEAILSDGVELQFDAGQRHKLRNVLRCSTGDMISVFNGRDGEWGCKLTELSRRDSSGILTEQIRPQSPAIGPAVFFAPLKRQRMTFLVEKATELGATAFRPILTEYSAIRDVTIAKLEATIREAAEQCHRLDLADISPPVPLFEALESLSQEQRLLYCDEASEGEQGFGHPSPGLVRAARLLGVLIGPEGGFSPDERSRLLKDARLVPISLGPRPLRAETAAIAAIACWHMLTDDKHSGFGDAVGK